MLVHSRNHSQEGRYTTENSWRLVLAEHSMRTTVRVSTLFEANCNLIECDRYLLESSAKQQTILQPRNKPISLGHYSLIVNTKKLSTDSLFKQTEPIRYYAQMDSDP